MRLKKASPPAKDITPKNIAFLGLGNKKKEEKKKKVKPKSQMQEALDHNKNINNLIDQM